MGQWKEVFFSFLKLFLGGSMVKKRCRVKIIKRNGEEKIIKSRGKSIREKHLKQAKVEAKNKKEAEIIKVQRANKKKANLNSETKSRLKPKSDSMESGSRPKAESIQKSKPKESKNSEKVFGLHKNDQGESYIGYRTL